jgi:hypothetical protein
MKKLLYTFAFTQTPKKNTKTNKGKSPLTLFVACFILGKVYLRTYRRYYILDIELKKYFE